MWLIGTWPQIQKLTNHQNLAIHQILLPPKLLAIYGNCVITPI